jgi:hypothetical protein
MNRTTLALGLCLALVVMDVSADDRVLPIVTGLRVEGDAVQTFHCKLGPNMTGNASTLTGALAERGNVYPLCIPAGQLEITEPIVWPGRTGYSLLGVGASKDLNDASYAGTAIGGQASRLVWHAGRTASTDDKMLDYKGLGGTIERIHFQGRPVSGSGTEPPGSTITGATNASPIVITSVNHGLSTGNTVVVQDCLGNTTANGTWTVTRLTADTFSLNDSNGTSSGTYTTTPAPGTWSDPKALVGIKVNTYQSGGSVLNCGKIAIRDCSFFQLQTGILFGPNMLDLGADGFTGETDNNADESSFNNLHFYYPYDNNTAHELRSCMRFRNNQAVDFDMSGIRVNGNPSEMFYFERGGKVVCTHASLSGASSATNPTTVLRIGKKTDGVSDFRVYCDIDGSSGSAGDQIGGHFKLLQMDSSAASNTYVELSGTISPVAYDTPIVVARGGATVVLRGVHGLNVHSLQLIGETLSSGEKRVCNVHLENCSLRGCSWPSELVDESSTGPFRLIWSNCTQFEKTGSSPHNYALPFADSEFTSTPSPVISGP